MKFLNEPLALYGFGDEDDWTIVNNLDTKRRKEKRLK